MVAFEVEGEVTEATEGSPFIVGRRLRYCLKLSADGTFDNSGFPTPGAPLPGTWEGGTDSSYVAEIDGERDGSALTLVQTGSVIVDEDGVLPDGSPRRELTAETTVSLTDGTVVVRTSDTGVEMDIDDFNNRQFLCQN